METGTKRYTDQDVRSAIARTRASQIKGLPGLEYGLSDPDQANLTSEIAFGSRYLLAVFANRKEVFQAVPVTQLRELEGVLLHSEYAGNGFGLDLANYLRGRIDALEEVNMMLARPAERVLRVANQPHKVKNYVHF